MVKGRWPRAAAVCAAMFFAPGAIGAIKYLQVEQTVSGTVNVFDFVDFEDQQSFSFFEHSATGVNETYSVDVSHNGFAPLIINGHLFSQFGGAGFSIDAASIVSIPDPGAFEGTAHNGAVSGNASALVMFALNAPTQVMYSIEGWPFAEFVRVDAPQVIAFSEFGTALGGQILLEAGVYAMSGGQGYDDNDDDGQFDNINSSLVFSFHLIPAPSSAGVTVLAGVAVARRRRG